ncbi:hypothetical protein BV25DRAFT_1915174 [Artomyces pyxidatus]|uniref:Uncharacterized protein n=1 Tax=Artomyces pyxidatus TaxID=48021 RepID=A0ACB8T5C9_9AGAM|nr:hypothetical protein BV25DRAFT_1915174 [Artomyces pyxidatus]
MFQQQQWLLQFRAPQGGGSFSGAGRGRGRGSFTTGANTSTIPQKRRSTWGDPSGPFNGKEKAADNLWKGADGSSATADSWVSGTAMATSPVGPDPLPSSWDQPADAANNAPWGAPPDTTSGWGSGDAGGWGSSGAAWGDAPSNIAPPSSPIQPTQWGTSSASAEPAAAGFTAPMPAASGFTAPMPAPPPEQGFGHNADASGSGWNVSMAPEPAVAPPPAPTTPIRQVADLSFEHMNVDESPNPIRRERQASILTVTSSRSMAKRGVPDSLKDRRDAIYDQVKLFQRAVHYRQKYAEADDARVNWLRAQSSKQFQQTGRGGRIILDQTRKDYDDRCERARKELHDTVSKLAELPELAEYVHGLDLDAEIEEARRFTQEVKGWRDSLESLVKDLVAKEDIAMVERSSEEPEHIPPSLDPLYARMKEMERKLDNVDETFYYQASIAFDTMLDTRLQQSHAALVDASQDARLKAQAKAMEAPLASLAEKEKETDKRLRQQADDILALILMKSETDDKQLKLKQEQEELRQQLNQATQHVQENDQAVRGVQDDLQRLREQIMGINAAMPPPPPTPDEIAKSLQGRTKQLVEDEFRTNLKDVHKDVLVEVQYFEREMLKALWDATHPIRDFSRRLHAFERAGSDEP